LSSRIERILGDQGLHNVSLPIGLFVCALPSPILFTRTSGHLIPCRCTLHPSPRAAATSLSGQALSDAVLVEPVVNCNPRVVLQPAMQLRLHPRLIGVQPNNWSAPILTQSAPVQASLNARTHVVYIVNFFLRM
ncbi:hypothetical protein B1218_37310, partial [Pseudomonas ogarae]